jgi:hypothetical protein
MVVYLCALFNLLQGKTVEVGRAHFETKTTRFTILDAPVTSLFHMRHFFTCTTTYYLELIKFEFIFVLFKWNIKGVFGNRVNPD